MARIISLLVAVVASLAGHGLLFTASFFLERYVSTAASIALPVFAIPFALVGIVLIGIAALTAAWSSLGVFVIGGVQTALGLFGAFFPTRIGTVSAPRVWFDGALLRMGAMGQTAETWLVLGLTLVEGLLLLALGWAATRRRRSLVARPALSRLLSVIVLFLALGPSTFLVIHGGYLDQQRIFTGRVGPDSVGLILFVLGALLLVGLMITTRWSGLGAIVWGAVLLFAGLSMSILPVLIPRSGSGRGTSPLGAVYTGLPNEVAPSILLGAVIGGVAVVGVTFLFGGIASARAGRVGHRRASFVEPRTAEVPEVAPRFLPSDRGSQVERETGAPGV